MKTLYPNQGAVQGLTQLQEWLVNLHVLVDDAKRALTPVEWSAFVAIASEVARIETERLMIDEVTRITKEAA